MWNVIVKNVCAEMDVVDAEFAKQGLAYLDCKSATMFYTSVPLPQSANGTATATSTATTAPAVAAPPNSLAWGAASIAAARGPNAFAVNQPQQPQMPSSLQDLDARYGQVVIMLTTQACLTNGLEAACGLIVFTLSAWMLGPSGEAKNGP